MDAVSKMASSLVIYFWSTHFFNRFFSLHKPLWFVKGFPCRINLQSLTIFLKINDKHSLNTLQALSIYPRWTIYKFETVSNNQYTQFGYRTIHDLLDRTVSKRKCAPKKHNTKATKRKLQCICKSRNTFPSSVLFCKRHLYLRILLSISSAITVNERSTFGLLIHCFHNICSHIQKQPTHKFPFKFLYHCSTYTHVD